MRLVSPWLLSYLQMKEHAVLPKPKNPDWTEDEHILALDLYLSKNPGQPQKRSPEVIALSKFLNRLHQKLGTQGEDTLRNPDGVT
jgi:5-methylcytosine-specific restriction protein A